MRRQTTALLFMSGFALAGCASGRGDTDLLTARLREQEQALADAQSQLTTKEKALAEAHRESETLRRQIAQNGSGALTFEQSELLVRVSGIKINSMLTAGVNRDDVAGDDALFLQFAPQDADGELVKLPGAIDIKVLDPALPETERTVAQWKFTAEESRQYWTRGFLGSGYQFTLPWPKSPPRNTELVVHVQLKPADGREFAATHVIKVTPPVVTAASHSTRKPAEFSPPQIKPPRAPLAESTNWTEFDTPVRR